MGLEPTPALATYTENLIDALVELGVEVYVIRLPRFGAKTPEILQNVAESIPLDKINVVHVQNEYGLYQGLEGGFYGHLKRLGKPVITTMHAVGSFEVDGVVSSASDAVIVHNDYCRRGFRHPCVVIPHGVKKGEAVAQEDAKKSLGIPPDARIVGYCGFISAYKGIETLVEAVRKLPDVALVVGGGWHAGPGTEYSVVLKAKSLSLLPGRCQWLGWVPDERLATVYGAMDLVAYPSLFATESGALLMALGYGKAVLANRITPFREKEKAGALMTFRSVTDLRRKIGRLFRDVELRRKLEEGAERYAEANSWANVAEKHLHLYEETIQKQKRS